MPPAVTRTIISIMMRVKGVIMIDKEFNYL